MKKLLAIILTGLTVSAFADTERVQVLIVDENGNLNISNVVATISDLARAEGNLAIANATAQAASNAYDEASTLLDQVAAQITDSEVIVYRKFFMDSFSAAVIIDPLRDKINICGFEESATQDLTGYKKYDVRICCTADIPLGSNVMHFRHSNSLTNSVTEWTELASAYVTGLTLDSGGYTDQDGNTYNFTYSCTVALPLQVAHFLIITLDPAYGAGDGSALTIVGGVDGGITTNVVTGNLTWRIDGGLVTGVTDSNASN